MMNKPNEQVVESVIEVKLFVRFGGHGQVQQGTASYVLSNIQLAQPMNHFMKKSTGLSVVLVNVL